ncbi:hypothetical protein LINPERHAP1_LOCUS32124 [Linum perenne]
MASTSDNISKGIPWLVTLNNPHFSQASTIRCPARGSERSITGIGNSRSISMVES